MSLPHQAPMLWVEMVVESSELGGVCELVFDPSAHYCNEHGVVRTSSPIEWLAQAAGQILARQHRLKLAFITGVEGFSFKPELFELKAGARLKFSVQLKRQIADFYHFDGKVLWGERELARGILKVYAQIEAS